MTIIRIFYEKVLCNSTIHKPPPPNNTLFPILVHRVYHTYATTQTVIAIIYYITDGKHRLHYYYGGYTLLVM